MVIIVICSVFSGVVLLVGLHNSSDNKTKICDIVNIIIATPAIKPANPAMEPANERTYQNYLKFQKLDKQFSC